MNPLKVIHIHTAFCCSLGSFYMTKSGTYKHDCLWPSEKAPINRVLRFISMFNFSIASLVRILVRRWVEKSVYVRISLISSTILGNFIILSYDYIVFPFLCD